MSHSSPYFTAESPAPIAQTTRGIIHESHPHILCQSLCRLWHMHPNKCCEEPRARDRPREVLLSEKQRQSLQSFLQRFEQCVGLEAALQLLKHEAQNRA